jgi:integrase/recombinase XerD
MVAAANEAPAGKLHGWVDAYLDHLRVERALAENTLAAYARDLGKFADHAEKSLAKRGEDTLDGGDVAAFLVGLSRQGLSARSSARHLSAVRGFAKFLVRERLLSEDPTALTDRPRIGRKLPMYLSESEVDTLLTSPNVAEPRGLRDAAMITLMYAAGLRVSELVGLRMGDLDLTRGTVSPLGKGGKRRIVPIAEVATSLVRRYVETVRPAVVERASKRAGRARGEASSAEGARSSKRVEGGRAGSKAAVESDTVFVSPRGGAFTRQGFWKLLRGRLLEAGVAKAISPHKLRHSFATHLVARGADLRVVQTLLGHASVTTTEVYTHVARDHVRATHAASHPRGR